MSWIVGITEIGEISNTTPFPVRVRNKDRKAPKHADVEIPPMQKRTKKLGNFPWVNNVDTLKKQRLEIWIDGQLRFYVWQSKGFHYYSRANWTFLETDWDQIFRDRVQFGPESDSSLSISAHDISKSDPNSDSGFTAQPVNPQEAHGQVVYASEMKIAARLADWIYAPTQKMCPEEVQVRDVITSHSCSAVQYAICVDERTNPPKCYVVFRGTVMTDLSDWAVNVSVTAARMASANGLIVHGGMLNELENPMVPVLTMLTEKYDLQSAKDSGSDIFVCGHSLGGGYAVLAAAHLLRQSFDVSQVFAFGAPQVVAKGQETNEVWQALQQVTSTVVHNCDIVPRTLGTSAENWLLTLTGPMAVNEASNAIHGFDVANAIGGATIGGAAVLACAAVAAAPIAAGTCVAAATVRGAVAAARTKQVAASQGTTPLLGGILDSLNAVKEKLYYYRPVGKIFRIASNDATGKTCRFTSHGQAALTGSFAQTEAPNDSSKLLEALCYYPEENISLSQMIDDHCTEKYIKCVDLLTAAVL